jgi:hypothetical protein
MSLPAFKSLPFTMRGAILGLVLSGAGIIAVAGFMTWFFTCPCERTPGGYLLGEVVEAPVNDWSFANEVSLCQIQISGLLPHSINLNCMATPAGNLYLSCSVCDTKYWSGAVQDNPSSRLRLNDTVYPVNINRVTDPMEMDQAWNARVAKLQVVASPGNPAVPPGTPRPDSWWTFRVTSR